MFRRWRGTRPLTISTPGEGFTIDPVTGNEIPAPPTTETVQGFLTQGRVNSGSENAVAQDTTIAPFTLLVPAGTTLTEKSIVTDPADDTEYTVLGFPADRQAIGSRTRFRAALLRRISDLQS